MMKISKGSAGLALFTVLAVLVVLIVLMLLIRPGNKPPPASQEAAVPVTVMTVQPSDIDDIVMLPAFVEANVDALLAAEKAGRITSIRADRGDRVKKEQLLLQLDDRIWQANLKQADVAAKDAQRTYERFRELQQSGAVAPSEYDRIETARIRAESMAEEARINIEQCRVHSPIDGVVNDRFVEEGEYVQPGTPVFQVVDTAQVKVVLQVPERDVYAVREGSRMRFSVEPLPDRIFEGAVTFIAAKADGRNNAFRAEITLDNSDGALRPGMIAQVEFNRGRKTGMVSLPMSAVLPSRGDHIVYLAHNGQAVRRKVQLESITRERALIADGLDKGDRVIIEGNRLLSDGQRVNILTEEAAP